MYHFTVIDPVVCIKRCYGPYAGTDPVHKIIAKLQGHNIKLNNICFAIYLSSENAESVCADHRVFIFCAGEYQLFRELEVSQIQFFLQVWAVGCIGRKGSANGKIIFVLYIIANKEIVPGYHTI